MYSRISGAKDGRGSIEYAEGIAHNGNQERNILVIPVNMIPNGKYAEQMEILWKMARRNHTIQTRRIVVSFSMKELDPYNPEDINTAKEIMIEFIKTYYPCRQAVLYFQRDGTGGCLHCHAIVNDISLTDHTGCTREQQHYMYVRKGIDAIASKYITLDQGEPTKSRHTRTERVKVEKAATIIKQNPNLKGDELRRTLISMKAYSYKEDMKNLIHEAMLNASNEKEFIRLVNKSGIEVVKKTSAKYGDHYVYNYKDCPIKVKNPKARSYKLGYSYRPEAARTLWAEKADQKKKSATDANDFVKWMNEQGQSCFTYDDRGHLIATDFGLWDELHERYEKEKSLIENQVSVTEKPVTYSADGRTESISVSSKPVKDPCIKDSTIWRQNPIKVDVFRKDMTAVSILIKDTEDIIRRLAEEQEKIKESSSKYSKARQQLSINNKKQHEKTL